MFLRRFVLTIVAMAMLSVAGCGASTEPVAPPAAPPAATPAVAMIETATADTSAAEPNASVPALTDTDKEKRFRTWLRSSNISYTVQESELPALGADTYAALRAGVDGFKVVDAAVDTGIVTTEDDALGFVMGAADAYCLEQKERVISDYVSRAAGLTPG
jgi:hypothetical protein